MNTSAAEYVNALKNRTQCNTSDLCGRIIRGKKDSDFLTLSDDPERKIVMLMGTDGLDILLRCKSGKEMLEVLGYEPSYIVRKVAEGNRFRLIVFPESTSNSHRATWEGVIKALALAYPKDIVSRVYRWLPELKMLRTPATTGWAMHDFEQLERVAGLDFSEIDKLGRDCPHFMTEERYRMSTGNLLDTRAFLYFTLHLRELFAGNGYTYDMMGNKGMMEYFCPNIEITQIADHATFDFDVNVN